MPPTRKRFIVRACLAAVAAVAVTLAVPGTALARPSSNGPDPRIAAALSRVADHTYTAADLALLRSYPDVARMVPDPTAAPEVGVTTRTVDSQGIGINGVIGIYSVDVSYTQKSLLGFTLYKWHHHVDFAANGTNVLYWQNRYDYITDVDLVIYFRELTADAAGPVNVASTNSFRQRHIEFCAVRIGCYTNTYPYGTITVRANGSFSHSGSAS